MSVWRLWDELYLFTNQDEIHNRLYNKESGLVQEKLNKLLSKDNQKGKATDIDEAILQLIGEIEEELSIFLKTELTAQPVHTP